MDVKGKEAVRTNENTIWVCDNEFDDFYRRLPLMDRAGGTERYLVDCQECDFKKQASGSKWVAIGKILEHRINDCPEHPHEIIVKDVSTKDT